MVLLIASLALAETDQIGGNDADNNEGDMLKLVAVEVDEVVAITRVRFALSDERGTDAVDLVVYQLVDEEYSLLGSAAASGLPDGGDGVADSGEVAWVLQPGEQYAVGAYVGGSWVYYYSDSSDDPWFGEVVGSYRVAVDATPDAFDPPDLEDYYYDMTIDSEPADSDADGAVAAAYGGPDCNDADASVGPTGVEVSYDGVDQDCDGADLDDLDGDGAAGSEAGGPDCDDSAAEINASAAEICSDEIDQDCSGADLACDEVQASGDCGCDAGSASAGLVAALAGAALIRRRRR